MVFIAKVSVDTSAQTPRIYYTWDVTVAKIQRYMRGGNVVILHCPAYTGDEIAECGAQTLTVLFASEINGKVTGYLVNANSSSPSLKHFAENADGVLETYVNGVARS